MKGHEINQPKGHWRNKKPGWAVELDDGTLHWVFDTRKDAKYVAGRVNARVVKVLVKYEEVR